MLRRLLPLFVLAAIGSAAPQTTVHESNHAAGFQSDKRSTNSEPQKEQERQPADLRLEHADVPMYPQLARTARIFGTVQVQVTVKEGKVVKTEVKSGPPVLTSATVENIQTWRFYPLVNATFTTKFTYQLETKEALDPQNPKVELQLPLLVKITAVPVTLDSQAGQTAKDTSCITAPFPGRTSKRRRPTSFLGTCGQS
ncbi:MAG TPA: energy transducer TonB [Candidatus Acidoferrum sp.]|nr:energy transducer TonB [Candidatus Acidoferrum sp.]